MTTATSILIPQKRASSPLTALNGQSNSNSNGNGKSRQVPTQRMPLSWLMFMENTWDEDDYAESLLILEGMIGQTYQPPSSLLLQLLYLTLHIPTRSRHLSSPSLDPLLPTSHKLHSLALSLLSSISPSTVLSSLPTYDRRASETENDEEDDRALSLGGKRLGRLENVWEVLRGVGGGKKRKNKEKERCVCKGGWEVLRVLVEMWEDEQDATGEGRSPSLLTQFKSTPYGPREISSKPLDIIFAPYATSPSSSSTSPSSTSPPAPEDPKTEEEEEEDEMALSERKKVAGRLFVLLGQLSMKNQIEPTNFYRQTSQRLSLLSEENLVSFLEYLPSPPSSSTSAFLIKFLMSHLDQMTHRPPVPNTNRSTSLSPRKFSSSSLLSQSQPQPSSTSHLPSLSQLTSTIFRLPRSLPLPTSASTVPNPKLKSFQITSMEKNVRMTEVLKEYLVGVAFENRVLGGDVRGVLEGLMEGVRGGRTRLEEVTNGH